MSGKKHKVVVTGADGFIGSHVVELLVRNGFEVRAFVMYNSYNSWGWLDHADADVVGNFEVIQGDIRDPFAVTKGLDGCDAVLHLAALIAIPFSYVAPQSYVETNVQGTLNVLQAARALEFQRVVVTSTSEVYGTAQFVPMSEDHPLSAQSPYAATKIAADQLALSFHKCFDTPVAVLRPFNTYGPRQSLRAVIPTIVGQILNGENVINLGAITPTRDFTHVCDTAKGFMQILQSENAVGKVINIGSNFEISIKDTVKMIAELLQKDIEIIGDSNRVRPSASEVERLFANTEVAQTIIDWHPKFGGMDGFRSGLADTLKWFSDAANLSSYKTNLYNI